jgi:hypothetical protein
MLHWRLKPLKLVLPRLTSRQIHSSLVIDGLRDQDFAGLGLPLERALAVLHGGALTIESENDREDRVALAATVGA